jgi:hypothetical protein
MPVIGVTRSRAPSIIQMQELAPSKKPKVFSVVCGLTIIVMLAATIWVLISISEIPLVDYAHSHSGRNHISSYEPPSSLEAMAKIMRPIFSIVNPFFSTGMGAP